METRQFWIKALERLAGPPLKSMAEGNLHNDLPLRHHPECENGRLATVHIELAGRLLSGLAPWFACPSVDKEESRLRDQMMEQAHIAIQNGSNPSHPDYWKPEIYHQPLVDASFLAEAFIRAPKVLWEPLDTATKARVINVFRSLHDRCPGFNNWLLFAATIEAFFASIGEPWDRMRVDYAIRQIEQWYVGDGLYNDGPEYHHDYYNSFVIQPMLFEVLEVACRLEDRWNAHIEPVRKRLVRFAEIQERHINHDGTWPVFGRSITYRTGAFHGLSFAAWKGLLSTQLPPAQVRCALTAAINRGLYPKINYDESGWLHIGLSGHQPTLGEKYITTSSCYLAAFVFPALGIPAHDPFWADPDLPWTAQRAWFNSGELDADTALRSLS